MSMQFASFVLIVGVVEEIAQPVLFHAWGAPLPPPLLMFAVTTAVRAVPGPTLTVVKPLSVAVTPVIFAATYGPTNGPPLPTGAAPAGVNATLEVSAKARARVSRPLPV